MLAVEEVLSELSREEVNEQGLPPGFRFHPTDEELITFYLGSKVFNGAFCGVEIAEVDLNRCEPWELPDVAKMGEREWYFFSLLDRKYPTGVRTNRATGSGYWKATGKDKEVYGGATGALLGMKKTLVFYKGRAPRGEKTKWVMHEYRLDGDFSCRHTCKEEWVICRILHKTGEKKNGVVPTRTSFPTLLESQTSIQALENDLKSQINPVVFTANNGFRQPCSAASTSVVNGGNSSAASMLFKSLISHQECMLKEQTAAILKQCKTETNFSQFQLSDATYSWMNKIHPNLSQNPMFFDMDYNNNVLGFAELN